MVLEGLEASSPSPKRDVAEMRIPYPERPSTLILRYVGRKVPYRRPFKANVYRPCWRVLTTTIPTVRLTPYEDIVSTHAEPPSTTTRSNQLRIHEISGLLGSEKSCADFRFLAWVCL